MDADLPFDKPASMFKLSSTAMLYLGEHNHVAEICVGQMMTSCGLLQVCE